MRIAVKYTAACFARVLAHTGFASWQRYHLNIIFLMYGLVHILLSSHLTPNDAKVYSVVCTPI